MEFSLLTWNIWFDEHQREHRTKELYKEIQQHKPDIVALQEVTPTSMDVLTSLVKEYHIVGAPIRQSYDTLILTKFPVLNWQRYQLPETKMGRNLLLAELIISDKTYHFGTFHLESLFRSKQDEQVKLSQLEYIEVITPPNTILMGDTNFKNTTDISSKSNLQDIYELIDMPKAYEYTYCGKTNKNIRNKRLNSRLDRIYLKSKERITSFYLMGMETQPSDHYGVFASLKYP